MELLIAAGLTGIMVAAVVVLLGRGLTAWKRTDGRLQGLFEVQKGISQWEKDLRNAAVIQEVPFEEGEGQWVFATASTPVLLNKATYRLVSLEDGEIALERTIQPLSRVEQEGVSKKLVFNLKKVQLQYAALEEGQGQRTLRWINAWDSKIQEKHFPKGIRFQVVVADKTGGADISFMEDVWIPQGEWGVVPDES